MKEREKLNCCIVHKTINRDLEMWKTRNWRISSRRSILALGKIMRLWNERYFNLINSQSHGTWKLPQFSRPKSSVSDIVVCVELRLRLATLTASIQRLKCAVRVCEGWDMQCIFCVIADLIAHSSLRKNDKITWE